MISVAFLIQTDVVVQLVILALTVAGLWIGAELFVDATVKLARRIKLSALLCRRLLIQIKRSRIGGEIGTKTDS